MSFIQCALSVAVSLWLMHSQCSWWKEALYSSSTAEHRYSCHSWHSCTLRVGYEDSAYSSSTAEHRYFFLRGTDAHCLLGMKTQLTVPALQNTGTFSFVAQMHIACWVWRLSLQFQHCRTQVPFLSWHSCTYIMARKSCLKHAPPFFSGHPAMMAILVQDSSFSRVDTDVLFLKLCSCRDESFFLLLASLIFPDDIKCSCS
jgi:hypothetical protein